MKKQYWSVVSALLIGASIAISGPAFGRLPGGGGGVPSPFADSNRKVELADGELYTLDGKVVFDSNGEAQFWVNLAKHPWLANKSRVAYPFYKLVGPASQWKKYNEKSVRLMCIAHVVTSGDGYEIQLEPVSDNDHSAK